MLCHTERLRDETNPVFREPLSLEVLREDQRLKLVVYDCARDGSLALVRSKQRIASAAFRLRDVLQVQAVVFPLKEAGGRAIPGCGISLHVEPVEEKTKVLVAAQARRVPRAKGGYCNPVVVLLTNQSLAAGRGNFDLTRFFSRTECARDCTDPVFEGKFCLDLPALAGETDLTWNLYNQKDASSTYKHSDLVGSATIPLSSLLARWADESEVVLKLRGDRAQHAAIVLSGRRFLPEHFVAYAQANALTLDLTAYCRDLPTLPPSSPRESPAAPLPMVEMEVYAKDPASDKFELRATSEPQANTDPILAASPPLGLRTFAEQELLFQLYQRDHSGHSAPRLLGSCTCTTAELLSRSASRSAKTDQIHRSGVLLLSHEADSRVDRLLQSLRSSLVFHSRVLQVNTQTKNV